MVHNDHVVIIIVFVHYNDDFARLVGRAAWAGRVETRPDWVIRIADRRQRRSGALCERGAGCERCHAPVRGAPRAERAAPESSSVLYAIRSARGSLQTRSERSSELPRQR